jgi:hypothetical protein
METTFCATCLSVLGWRHSFRIRAGQSWPQIRTYGFQRQWQFRPKVQVLPKQPLNIMDFLGENTFVWKRMIGTCTLYQLTYVHWRTRAQIWSRTQVCGPGFRCDVLSLCLLPASVWYRTHSGMYNRSVARGCGRLRNGAVFKSFCVCLQLHTYPHLQISNQIQPRIIKFTKHGYLSCFVQQDFFKLHPDCGSICTTGNSKHPRVWFLHLSLISITHIFRFRGFQMLTTNAQT